MLKGFGTVGLIVLVSLIALDGYGWYAIMRGHLGAGARSAGTREYFLDVGQGDSELVILENGVKVMTDAGPDKKVVESMNDVLPSDDRYVDLAIISHAEADHFGGYNFLLDGGYRFGAFVYNGRDAGSDAAPWRELLRKIAEGHIPLLTLGAGDAVRAGSAGIEFLSPDQEFLQSADLNDTALVELITASGLRTLLTADAGIQVESFLLANPSALRAEVLKIGHHGSKYSSGDKFLRAVDPKVAVIGVGEKNTYGHPSKDALARIASSTRASVFRTDRNGTVEVLIRNGTIMVYAQRPPVAEAE